MLQVYSADAYLSMSVSVGWAKDREACSIREYDDSHVGVPAVMVVLLLIALKGVGDLLIDSLGGQGLFESVAPDPRCE